MTGVLDVGDAQTSVVGIHLQNPICHVIFGMKYSKIKQLTRKLSNSGQENSISDFIINKIPKIMISFAYDCIEDFHSFL